ncbi:MAG: hypothetical protein OEV42_06555 [Deltaproteobacteria bacterium]|nr:hypothetical protein [Deltaproteobacteria bacterium]
MLTFPSIAEQLIEERVKNLLGLKKEDPLSAREFKKLALKVKELSDYFTKRQDARPDDYLRDSLLMAAYMAYFVPANLLKIEIPLVELFLHPRLKARTEEISLLDLGSGPGTASAGFINFFFQHLAVKGEIKGVSIKVADRVKENLHEAQVFLKELWRRYESFYSEEGHFNFSLTAVKVDLHQMAPDSPGMRKYDLVVMSNSLVETGEGDGRIDCRMTMIENIAERYLKKEGALLIIEPALRDASRDLLRMRDEIIKKGELTLYSPCLDSGPCLALENKKDWCHEVYGWQPPKIVEEIDKRTAFEKSSLKFSCLVIRKDGLSLRDLFRDGKDETFRVVSDLLVMKGEKRVFLCGHRGRIQLGRLNRDKSEKNGHFDDLRRGDIVQIKGVYAKGSLLRIGRESCFKILSFKD